MKSQTSSRSCVAGVRVALTALGLLLALHAFCVGTWTPLVNRAPGSVGLMLLLSDGTVMAANNPVGVAGCCFGNAWSRLTPDAHGSFVNGTWSSLASMHDSRLFYSSAVLRDGRVFVAGGEYGSGTATAEVYNPTSDTWTTAPVPTSLLDPSQRSPILLGNINQGFLDSQCRILPNGNVLVSPVAANGNGETMIFDPVANAWSAGPPTGSVYQDEATWVKLPDDSILTIDPFGTATERFIPSLNRWIADSSTPVQMYDAVAFETGPGFLLPDGRAFFVGGTGHTLFYTPSGTTNLGTWTQGPDIPGGLVAQDAPGAILPNGKILCAVGPPVCCRDPLGNLIYPGPTSFFEFDPVANSFAAVSGPTGPTDSPAPYQTVMLDLPDGNVLYAHFQQGNLTYNDFGSQLHVYHPDGVPVAVGKPVITGITINNADGSFHLTGTGLNGISEGASYGDDDQMCSNYPLVRLTDGSGNVYYARTFNWSSTGVRTGSRIVSTEFSLPPGLAGNTFSLVVVANGISSDPVSFFGPVWVDFIHSNPFQFGTFDFPFLTLSRGVSAVSPGGTIYIKPGNSTETLRISKAMTIVAVGGSATIGR